MNQPMLPKVLSKYLPRICKEYFHALQKHPKFAKHWCSFSKMNNEYWHEWMKDLQSNNDVDEESDNQNVFSIFKEETLEAFDSITKGDEKNARTELIQGIVVRLRALEKLDKEGL